MTKEGILKYAGYPTNSGSNSLMYSMDTKPVGTNVHRCSVNQHSSKYLLSTHNLVE